MIRLRGTLNSQIFRFKQFDVDQTGCAMKINTDGVLLGALAGADHPKTILDIGTGTGVIALMLAQRFANAQIDAVEIDLQASETARRNFAKSSFSERLIVYPLGFDDFFEQYPDRKYDLIVSNPPFYINSLKSPQKGRQVAKHADQDLFNKLIKAATAHLWEKGVLNLVLPVDTAELVTKLGEENGLFVTGRTAVRSFADAELHRLILSLAKTREGETMDIVTIYKAANTYSQEYIRLLQPYFIAF